MKTLALELSSGQGSIAWCEPEQESFSISFTNDRKHSGLFFENLEKCLQRLGNPERIVVGLGPGSYAGTRIAISTAIGLQAASGARVVGVASLCAMETDANEYAVVGDARRHSFFFALVRARLCCEGPLLYSRDELVQRLQEIQCPVFRSEAIEAFTDAELAYPSALLLAHIAPEVHAETSPLEPIYLRTPHITYPRISSVTDTTR